MDVYCVIQCVWSDVRGNWGPWCRVGDAFESESMAMASAQQLRGDADERGCGEKYRYSILQIARPEQAKIILEGLQVPTPHPVSDDEFWWPGGADGSTMKLYTCPQCFCVVSHSARNDHRANCPRGAR